MNIELGRRIGDAKRKISETAGQIFMSKLTPKDKLRIKQMLENPFSISDKDLRAYEKKRFDDSFGQSLFPTDTYNSSVNADLSGVITSKRELHRLNSLSRDQLVIEFLIDAKNKFKRGT